MKYDWGPPGVLWPVGQGWKPSTHARAGIYVLTARRRAVLEELRDLGMLTGEALAEIESVSRLESSTHGGVDGRGRSSDLPGAS